MNILTAQVRTFRHEIRYWYAVLHVPQAHSQWHHPLAVAAVLALPLVSHVSVAVSHESATFAQHTTTSISDTHCQWVMSLCGTVTQSVTVSRRLSLSQSVTHSVTDCRRRRSAATCVVGVLLICTTHWLHRRSNCLLSVLNLLTYFVFPTLSVAADRF